VAEGAALYERRCALKQRMIAEKLLYRGVSTRHWTCYGCGQAQYKGAAGYYYNTAHPCEMGQTRCEPCIDKLCLRLAGKAPPLPVQAPAIGDLFRDLLPWETP